MPWEHCQFTIILQEPQGLQALAQPYGFLVAVPSPHGMIHETAGACLQVLLKSDYFLLNVDLPLTNASAEWRYQSPPSTSH